MLQPASDDGVIIERVAAVDVGKAEVVCCVRVPTPGRVGQRSQEVRSYSTMTRSLLEMNHWLTGLGVTRVVMEATSDTDPESIPAPPGGCRARGHHPFSD